MCTLQPPPLSRRPRPQGSRSPGTGLGFPGTGLESLARGVPSLPALGWDPLARVCPWSSDFWLGSARLDWVPTSPLGRSRDPAPPAFSWSRVQLLPVARLSRVTEAWAGQPGAF